MLASDHRLDVRDVFGVFGPSGAPKQIIRYTIEGWKAQLAVEEAKEEKHKAKCAIKTRNDGTSIVQSTPERNHLPTLLKVPSHPPSTSPLNFVGALEQIEALHTSGLADLSPAPTPVELKRLSCTPTPLASININTLVDPSKDTPVAPKGVDGECSTVQRSNKKRKVGDSIADASSSQPPSTTISRSERLGSRSIR